MDKETLKDRTKQLALRITQLAKILPTNFIGKNVGSQIFRASTSVAANYRAALRGRSKAEFASKLSIVIEEADETLFWLEFIEESNLIPAEKLALLKKETNEILSIMIATRKTATARK